MRRIDRREQIAIGTATDPYQPAERRYGRTRSILEVFAREKGWRLGMVTKSDLVTRDIDLLREVARRNVLSIHMTITTLDEKLARLLEPRAPRPALRLEAVRKLSEAGLAVGVTAKPIMPALTDGERALDRLGKAAKDAGARSFHGGAVFLMPSALQVFLPFLERHFPLPGAALSRAVRAERLPGAGLQGRAAGPAAEDPRALRPGRGNARLQARIVGGGAGHAVLMWCGSR